MDPGDQPPARIDDAAGEHDVEVVRSSRRLRTVTAYRRAGRIVVLIPERFTQAQEHEWVAIMVGRLRAQERRRRPGDDELQARAEELSGRYLGGLAKPASVSWSTHQNSRWGSCTPVDATIRLSTRLQGMPAWVIDYVLVHELAHLLEQGHGPRFWKLLEAYPRTERARGFLDGYSAAVSREGDCPERDDGLREHTDSRGRPDDDDADEAPGDAAASMDSGAA